VNQIKDNDQREYFKNFVVPVGTKMLSDRLKITSNGKLPAFGENVDYCNDNGELTIPQKYKDQEIDGDFVLFVGGFTEETSTIAYATFCLTGKVNDLCRKFWPTRSFKIFETFL